VHSTLPVIHFQVEGLVHERTAPHLPAFDYQVVDLVVVSNAFNPPDYELPGGGPGACEQCRTHRLRVQHTTLGGASQEQRNST
jgi:hypothetical protein